MEAEINLISKPFSRDVIYIPKLFRSYKHLYDEILEKTIINIELHPRR